MIKKLQKHQDEEELRYYYVDLEITCKGIHHIMEINGILLQNQAHEISDHVGKTLLPFYAKIIAKINKNTKICFNKYSFQ